MSTTRKLNEIRERARRHFEDALPSHDWYHVERVLELGKKIANEEGGDERMVEVAVLLHDIGRQKEFEGEIDDHAEWGASRSREILEELDFEPDFVDEVEHCIRSHRYSNDIEPRTIEAKVVCDADNLDALGAVGIARCFAFGGEIRETIYDPLIPESVDETDVGETQVNHIRKKILDLKERMYTPTGEEMARERERFVEEFVERLEKEAKGEL